MLVSGTHALFIKSYDKKILNLSLKHLQSEENQPDTFERSHSYLLLVDDGSEGERKTANGNERYFINDDPRTEFVNLIVKNSDCFAVTIIIEGGLYSLEVILNDLIHKRPVVIIHGSGRLATAIGDLLNANAQHSTIK